jgi:hypothetical protein
LNFNLLSFAKGQRSSDIGTDPLHFVIFFREGNNEEDVCLEYIR